MDLLDIRIRADTSGADEATSALDKTTASATRTGRATDSLAQTFRTLAPIVGTVMAAFSVRALREYADGWSDMQSKVGAAVRNMEAAPALMERMVEVANASYSPLSQTVEIYSRNVAVLRDLGRSATDAADFTEALNHALVLTATKGQQAESVQNALSRAMATGKLQAQGLETILANGGEVAQVLADALGTNVNGLRAMASQGKITGEVVASALIGRLDDLRERAAEMPATVGDAFQRISTNFQALVGRVDQATGSSENFAMSLVGLADTIRAGTDDIVRAALVIQTGLSAAMEWASGVARSFGGDFDTASALISLGAGAATFAVLGLATAITGTLISAITALGAVMLANPFTLFIAAIATAVTASYLFRDEISDIIGFDLFKVFYDGANDIIGHMKGAYDAAVVIWQHLPGEFGRIGKLAWNALMDGLGSIELDWTNPFTGNTTRLIDFDMSSLKRDLNESESYVEAVAGAAYRVAQGVDYLGNAGERLGTVWAETGERAAASFADLANGVNSVGTAMDEKASKAAQKLADAYKRIVDAGKEFIAQQQLEANLIGMTEQAANALRYEFNMLADAKAAGITLTEKQRAELGLLAQAMSAAEAATKALQDAYQFTREVVGGFVSDLRNGLKAGENFFEAFANTANRALDRVVDKLLNDVLDALFQVNRSGFGGGGGIFGVITSLFGGGGGFNPTHGGFANLMGIPGYADGTNFHPGGMAWVGERGRELVNLPRGSQVYSAERSQQMVANSNTPQAANINYAPVYNIDAPGGDPREIVGAIEAYDKGRLARLAKDIPELRKRGALK